MASRRYTMSIAAGPDSYSQACGAQSRKGKALKGWANLIAALMGGSHRGGQVDVSVDDGGGGTSASQIITYVAPSGAQTIAISVPGGPAAGVLSMSSGTGAVGGTIGGTAKTVTWATSDAASCDALAAAINADATLSTYVYATSRAATGTVTISSGSGVITATIGGVAISVTWATSDTATATALAAAINAKAYLPVIASSSAGVVTLYAEVGGTPGNSITLTAAGTGATASGATLANGGTNANVMILSLSSGAGGNGITLVASGTGVTAPTGARFVGGINNQLASVSFTAGADATATAVAAVAAIQASAVMMQYVRPSSVAGVVTLAANALPRAAALGNGTFLAITGTGANMGTIELTGGVSSTDAGYAL